MRPHVHPGVEFPYVIRGRLTLSVGGVERILATGDSVYPDSTLRHGYRRKGSTKGSTACAALVAAVP